MFPPRRGASDDLRGETEAVVSFAVAEWKEAGRNGRLADFSQAGISKAEEGNAGKIPSSKLALSGLQVCASCRSRTLQGLISSHNAPVLLAIQANSLSAKMSCFAALC